MKLSAPLPDAETHALVVYVNSAVALALAGRLIGCSSVTLASLPEALETVARQGRIDVVVMCPYLTGAERALLTEACKGHPTAPPCVELVDTPGRPTTVLRSLDAEPTFHAAVGRVLEALAA